MKNESIVAYPLPTFGHYFVLEDFELSDIEDFPGDYEETEDKCFYEDFYEAVEAMVEQKMTAALERLRPVFEVRRAHHVSVGVNKIGFHGTLAQCFADPQSRDEALISIMLGPSILESLLNEYWYPNCKEQLHYVLTLDHELVHGLDSECVVFSHIHLRSEAPKDHLLAWLMGFRIEGLACLTTFLRGIDGERSLKKTRRFFARQVAKFQSLDLSQQEKWKEESTAFQTGYDVYRYGPLAMLHAIWCKASEIGDSQLMELAAKGADSQVMDDEEISRLILAGLEIGHREFIESLTLTGKDGEPLLKAEDLILVMNKIQTIDFTEAGDKDPSRDEWPEIQAEVTFEAFRERYDGLWSEIDGVLERRLSWEN